MLDARGEDLARVLAAHTGSSRELRLHHQLGGVLVGHATLRRIQFPFAPRGGGGGVLLCEHQAIVAADEDVAGEPLDGFLLGGFQSGRQRDAHTGAQVPAQCGRIGVPHFEHASVGTPIAHAVRAQIVDDRVQVDAGIVVERHLVRPCVAVRVACAVESGRHDGGRAAPRTVLVEQRVHDHARCRRIERAFAIVASIGKQRTHVQVEDFLRQPDPRHAVERDRIRMVFGVPGAGDEQEPAIVRFHPCTVMCGDLHADLEALLQPTFEDVPVERNTRVGHRQGARVIVLHARRPRARLQEPLEHPGTVIRLEPYMQVAHIITTTICNI